MLGNPVSILNLQIYPYWNVNPESEEKREKDGSLQIYPYWNVNEYLFADAFKSIHLQIYPYWNVNFRWAVLSAQFKDFKSIHTGM